MKNKIIACLTSILVVGFVIAGINVFATNEETEEQTTDTVAIEESNMTNLNNTEEQMEDISDYLQTETSAFSVMSNHSPLYFDNLQDVFNYLSRHDGERGDNTISIISDIIFDKDYTIPTLSIPINFTSDTSRMIDMNGYSLYDEFGNKVDLNISGNILVVDNVVDNQPVDEIETVPEETILEPEVTEEEPIVNVVEKKIYRYLDANGEIIDEQTVEDEKDLVPPEIPEIKGLSCLGWGDPVDEGYGIYTLTPKYFKLG